MISIPAIVVCVIYVVAVLVAYFYGKRQGMIEGFCHVFDEPDLWLKAIEEFKRTGHVTIEDFNIRE